MSDEEKRNVISETKKTKWFTIATAIVTLIKTIIEVILG